MEIQENSRQIPSDIKYTSSKNYSDILYGYLQHMSIMDPCTNARYVKRADINYVKIAEDLNITRQTVSKKFKALVEEGLLIENKYNKIYFLRVLEPSLAALLPDDTLRVLINTLQERGLSILTYLLKTFIQHGERPCVINLDILKDYVGLNRANRGTNNQIIKDNLIVLERLGLIRYHKERRLDEKSGYHKVVYVLDFVNNMINFKEKNIKL